MAQEQNPSYSKSQLRSHCFDFPFISFVAVLVSNIGTITPANWSRTKWMFLKTEKNLFNKSIFVHIYYNIIHYILHFSSSQLNYFLPINHLLFDLQRETKRLESETNKRAIIARVSMMEKRLPPRNNPMVPPIVLRISSRWTGLNFVTSVVRLL